MKRKLSTVIGLTVAILSLSACNAVDTVNQVSRMIPAAPNEGFTPAAPTACEGATCPTPPPVSYPCVSGQAEGAITEGAGSHICP